VENIKNGIRIPQTSFAREPETLFSAD
jgi:hypothetical protein